MTIEQVQGVVDSFVKGVRSVPHAPPREIQIEALRQALSSTLACDVQRLRSLAGELALHSVSGSEIITAHADYLEHRDIAEKNSARERMIALMEARRKSNAEKTSESDKSLSSARRPHREL